MVDFILGLGLALPLTTSISVATVTGVAEGVSYQRKLNEEASNESRQLKFHVDCFPDPSSSSPSHSAARVRARSSLEDTMLVLRDERVWLVPRDKDTGQPTAGQHPFTGFYLPYPDEERQGIRGLVSTISREPPVLNWLYVHRETGEVKYANRTGSIKHLVGEWDWTEESGPGSRLTFDGWEGFVAVAMGDGTWQLFVDVEDDGLKGREEVKGRRKVEVMLKRRVISEQEVNKWGLGSSGNLGVKKTEHNVKGKDMLKEAEGS